MKHLDKTLANTHMENEMKHLENKLEIRVYPLQHMQHSNLLL
jgi:hypothetical protein